jgi:putative transposase
MPRLPRIVAPGIAHHIVQRGNRGQQVFFGVEDSLHYLKLLHQAGLKEGLHIRAWCLMPDHVHLIAVPETQDSLRAAISWTHRHYAEHINQREGWRGHFWQERFQSAPLSDTYLATAAAYVELNPVRAALVYRARDWRWSSAYARLRGRADALIADNALLELDGGDWQAHLDAMHARAHNATSEDPFEAIRRHTRTGRPLGDNDFIRHVERATGRRLAKGRPGRKPKAGDSAAQAHAASA